MSGAIENVTARFLRVTVAAPRTAPERRIPVDSAMREIVTAATHEALAPVRCSIPAPSAQSTASTIHEPPRRPDRTVLRLLLRVCGRAKRQHQHGGFENIYINYIYTATSPDFGQVAVIHAKLPTTPRTFAGEPRMGTGQLRFWSMCTGNYPSTATYACLVDKDVPVDVTAISRLLSRPLPPGQPTPSAAAASPGCPPARPTRPSSSCATCSPPRASPRRFRTFSPATSRRRWVPSIPSHRYYQTTSDFERLGCRTSAPPRRVPAAHPRHRKPRHAAHHRKPRRVRHPARPA